MEANKMLNYIKDVLQNMPNDWINLTTHRLDIYNEELAKTQFIEEFDKLFQVNNASAASLNALPTAYDYIRLGHPLSCVLEWVIANLEETTSKNVISFSSQTVPILAILRKNLFEKKNTQIIYKNTLPSSFDAEIVKRVYGYEFELKKVDTLDQISNFNGSTIYVSEKNEISKSSKIQNIDFSLNLYSNLGSVLIINNQAQEDYISEIQHVRRRETIAMTPINCLLALNAYVKQSTFNIQNTKLETNKNSVLELITNITGTTTKPLVASSGLSMQYAIMMGLVHDAQVNHKGKAIKFIVPPNCYGGTNDQARRVAACIDNVEVVDLPVDGENDMVSSIHTVLDEVAKEDAVPYIIAEIPTNPRVEVPNLGDLRDALKKPRKTSSGEIAVDPVFILDQTFCPNTLFLGENEILSTVRAISYASGSKFPSGGKCTAGYCVANKKAKDLMDKIDLHLELCDNEATALQYEILAAQLPSMNQRIKDAYQNTRAFVDYIKDKLPEAKINFVSQELAQQGFTPSVFSLGLPTKGNTPEEKEAYKRDLNLRLIHLMITEIPNESKYCVSYGQLKGCYWTIPATSTQGTTKEGDKDYIVRASLSPNLDLERHKEVFSKFVDSIE
nr:cystathionine beta-synthase [uncultured Psychroserpens sp.]